MKVFAREQRLFPLCILALDTGLNMGLATIFVLYVSFMLIYSDQADVIEERGESLEICRLPFLPFASFHRIYISGSNGTRETNGKSRLAAYELDRAKDKRTIGMRNKNHSHSIYGLCSSCIYVYVRSKDKRGKKKGSQSYYRYRYKWIINFDSSLVTLRKENIKDSKHY